MLCLQLEAPLRLSLLALTVLAGFHRAVTCDSRDPALRVASSPYTHLPSGFLYSLLLSHRSIDCSDYCTDQHRLCRHILRINKKSVPCCHRHTCTIRHLRTGLNALHRHQCARFTHSRSGEDTQDYRCDPPLDTVVTKTELCTVFLTHLRRPSRFPSDRRVAGRGASVHGTSEDRIIAPGGRWPGVRVGPCDPVLLYSGVWPHSSLTVGALPVARSEGRTM